MATETLHGRASNGEEQVSAVLDTIGDERTRRVLVLLNRKPRGAVALKETLDVSLPTVYRHIERLKDQDLIEGATRIADDGNHYEVFEPTFDSAVISLDDARYDLRIYRDAVEDRFAELWDDLGDY